MSNKLLKTKKYFVAYARLTKKKLRKKQFNEGGRIIYIERLKRIEAYLDYLKLRIKLEHKRNK